MRCILVLGALLASRAAAQETSLDGFFDSTSFRLTGGELDEERLKGILAAVERDAEAAQDDLKEQALQFEQLVENMEGVTEIYQKVKAEQEEVDALVGKANAFQIERVIQELINVFSREEKLRLSSNVAQLNTTSDSKVKKTIPTVTKQTLKRMLNKAEIMRDSEAEIRDWILEIVSEEIEKVQAKYSILDEKYTSEDCAPYSKVAEKVHSEIVKLSQDGIGLVDHAQGSTIVYEMSSDTYQPKSGPKDELGNVWWRKFIPEDWEDQLPKGWESWDTTIPSYVYSFLKLENAKIAPHDAILSGNTSPGMCWPMGGQSGQSGQVTIRLAYPVKFSGITVDHASAFSVHSDELDSAPQKITVVAYEPCSDGDEECARMGFDSSDPVKVLAVSFARGGPDAQTFSITPASPPQLDTEKEKALLDDDDDDGSCSATAATCSSPPSIIVKAITFKIESNWGHPDYTCLYRLRVHGEKQ